VLRLVGNGLTNAQIAQRLVLSDATVKTHVKRVMAKLHLTSHAQPVVTAYETGLVVPSASNDRSGAPPR
jgi:DNA-binding NarL/FixJ family response regulator